MKCPLLLFTVLCVLLAAGMAFTGCTPDSEEDEKGKGGEADLIKLSIGGLLVAHKAGVSATSWNAANFSVRSMECAEIKLLNSRMDKPTISADISAGAAVRFARMSTEEKPSAFAASSEFTFTTGDSLYIQVSSEDESKKNYYRVLIFSTTGDARLQSMKISGALATLAAPGKTSAGAQEGSVTIRGLYDNDTVQNPVMIPGKETRATAEYATGEEPGSFSASAPALPNGTTLWVKITAEDTVTVLYYKIKVTVEYSIVGYGTADPAWAADSYNANLRVFPNAPSLGILEYNYFDQNAPVSYWNNKGHNHKYPDLFHFANGNKVMNIADWENRQKEISNILQYYMHGRMPSIEPDELDIRFSDSGNTCTIRLTHAASGRTAEFVVSHTPPADALAGSRNGILLFGVGFGANARAGWGSAAFQTSWGGSESNRSGTCATLYGLTSTADDTPSVNMEYAWAMSVILTVIEQGGLRGYYDPEKIGIYGFSRYGKAAMLIGAFAQSRGGNQIGFTFVGSAGSGGPAIDRWINQMGYKNHTEDPLPVDGEGAKNFADLNGIEWYLKSNIPDDHNATTAAQVVRAWTAGTPGIPGGSHTYGEQYDFIRNPGPPEDWGRIQVLAQARNETQGWFSARFRQFSDLHNGLRLDKNSGEGVLCSMPFDAHFISALIAPRIIYYEDGYNTMRNNPEGQWANWLICDEIYQMYAEELGDPSIVWRNAIKMYDIEHNHFAYQDRDEADLVNAIYGKITPNAKFRTPPFPADDPRYRWDFDRMDFGRPGHPSIAERVRLMRESPVKVKAMDARGLPDSPEPLQ